MDGINIFRIRINRIQTVEFFIFVRIKPNRYMRFKNKQIRSKTHFTLISETKSKLQRKKE